MHFRKITNIVEDELEIGKAGAERPASKPLYYFWQKKNEGGLKQWMEEGTLCKRERVSLESKIDVISWSIRCGSWKREWDWKENLWHKWSRRKCCHSLKWQIWKKKQFWERSLVGHVQSAKTFFEGAAAIINVKQSFLLDHKPAIASWEAKACNTNQEWGI